MPNTIDRRRFFGLCLAAPVLSCVADDEWGLDATTPRSVSAVNVLEPAAEQSLSSSRHCSISLELSPGLELGDQVRITRSLDEYALYTVVERRDEPVPGTVRMSASGRERLGAPAIFAAEIDTIVTASELDDAEAKAASELVERLVDDGIHSGLLVAAAHGGSIEARTDKQADRVVELLPGISSWVCKGWRSPNGAFARWHITSTELNPNSFPGLATIAERGFANVVSFHGMSGPGVIVGGRASIELRELVRMAIVDAINDPGVAVTLSGFDGPLSGVGPENFVNWLSTDGGIQIEQSWAVRAQYWAEIAEAVAGVFGPML